MNPICDSLRQQRQQLQTMLAARQVDRDNLQARIAIAELRVVNADPSAPTPLNGATAAVRLAALWAEQATQMILLGAPLSWIVQAIAAYSDLMTLYGELLPILRDIADLQRRLAELDAQIQAEGC